MSHQVPLRLRLFAGATIIAIGGLLIPHVKGGWIVAFVVVSLVLITFATRRRDTRLANILMHDGRTRFALFNAAVIAIVLGFTELTVAALVDRHVIESYRAMQTVLPEGTEDWRAAHITADEFREPDPALWWRPVRRAPYNAQGFKGPVVDANNHSALRVMTYGDSNTDGPDRGSWPERLHEVLNERSAGRFEVINAGVAGYSSHQGIRRFAQDAPRYRPDVVTVAFGWNDPATTNGQPDSAFAAPPEWQAHTQRALLRYKSYLVLLNWLKREDTASATMRSRVSLEEYVRNIDRFRELAEDTHTKVVLMTRPHRETPQALRAMTGAWRSQVPDYNDAIRRYAEDHSAVVLIDVQKLFEPHVDEFIDECHFTASGHARMALSVRDALDQAGLQQ